MRATNHLYEGFLLGGRPNSAVSHHRAGHGHRLALRRRPRPAGNVVEVRLPFGPLFEQREAEPCPSPVDVRQDLPQGVGHRGHQLVGWKDAFLAARAGVAGRCGVGGHAPGPLVQANPVENI